MIRAKSRLSTNLDYTGIMNTNSDQLKDYDEIMWDDEPFLVTNIFPFEVILRYIRYPPTKQPPSKPIIKDINIKSHTHINVELLKEDEVHVLQLVNGKLYEICRPIYINRDTRNLKIGDIAYTDRIINYTNSQADVSGIRFHNRASMPFKIYLYRQVPIKKGPGYAKEESNIFIATIGGDDELEFNGRSKNNVYLDNDANGYKIGDEFRITMMNGTLYAKIVIPDQKAKDVYFGLLTQKYTAPPPDIAAYRIDRSNILSMKYYAPKSVVYTTHRLARDPVDL